MRKKACKWDFFTKNDVNGFCGQIRVNIFKWSRSNMPKRLPWTSISIRTKRRRRMTFLSSTKRPVCSEMWAISMLENRLARRWKAFYIRIIVDHSGKEWCLHFVKHLFLQMRVHRGATGCWIFSNYWYKTNQIGAKYCSTSDGNRLSELCISLFNHQVHPIFKRKKNPCQANTHVRF